MPSHKLNDLVFLRFASNVCYVEAVAKLPADVKLDLPNGKWTYVPTNRTQKIGDDRPIEGHGGKNSHATIGVYDRSMIKQLSAMARDAGEAAKDRSSLSYDELL